MISISDFDAFATEGTRAFTFASEATEAEATEVEARAKSCFSRSARSFDRLPWNSGFAILHG